MDQSTSAQELVCHKESWVEGKQEGMQQREQQLHAALQALYTATTQQGTCLGMFPNVHTITTITKVAEAAHEPLQAATIVITT